MKRLHILLTLVFPILFLAPSLGQDEPDKIGTVNMQKLLQDYYKTKKIDELFKGYSQEVVDQNEKRMETIKEMTEGLRDLQKEIESPNLPKEKQEELFRKAQGQQSEIRALQGARMEWLQRKNAAFAEKRNIDLGELRLEIMEMVKEVGESEGFDFIFDRSGASGANIQILAYAKDATDLTSLMLERINRDAPEDTGEEEKPKENPEEEKSGEE